MEGLRILPFPSPPPPILETITLGLLCRSYYSKDIATPEASPRTARRRHKRTIFSSANIQEKPHHHQRRQGRYQVRVGRGRSRGRMGIL